MTTIQIPVGDSCIIYYNGNNISFGRGEGGWAFFGGSFYPSNTLDRTLFILTLNTKPDPNPIPNLPLPH